MNLLEKLQTTYDESCLPVHDALSMEPEYECEYCGHRDVAPAHSNDCPAVDAVMAKHEIERVSAENSRYRKALEKLSVLCYVRSDSPFTEHMEIARHALERVSTGQTRNIGEEIIEGLEAIRDHPEKLKRIDCTQNGNTCPGCGGPADNGHDRSIPPNPYYCVACHDAGIVDHD